MRGLVSQQPTEVLTGGTAGLLAKDNVPADRTGPCAECLGRLHGTLAGVHANSGEIEAKARFQVGGGGAMERPSWIAKQRANGRERVSIRARSEGAHSTH
jgi:hypothetical protein